ncbi:MAG: glutaredoxin family protein [Actinomycetota bacterium]|nr:glutaredoxin family protein [Actinomycetota bacterium]
MSVALYSLSTCPYCRMTRRFLDDKNVEYELTEVDLLEGQEKEDTVAKIREISGGASFPVVVIDQEVLVGFNKKRMKELLDL